MNRNDLYKSFTEVDDDALLRTELRRKTHHTHPRMRVIAASLALILCLFGISFLFTPDNTKGGNSSWFVITAYAADGELEELELNDGFFNSVDTEGVDTMFGVDAPLFSFVVKPANWDGNQETYSSFSITISCNGKIVDSLDDHVAVTHLYPVPGSDAPYECQVVGWLEEPTDITISIYDKNTGDLIEEQIVNVCYTPESQAYQLTVTNVQTNDVVK